MQRATPLDMRAHWQAAGMWRGPALGEVLIWPWSALPDAKGVEPSRTLAVRAPAGQRLGSVRPLRMDADGRLFVAVEWLAGERRLEVTQQVLQIDGADRRRAVQWRAATYAPGLQDLEVAEDGTVWRLYHSPGAVHLEPLPAQSWHEVPR